MLNNSITVKSLAALVVIVSFTVLTPLCGAQGKKTPIRVQTPSKASFDLAQAVREATENSTVKIPAGTYALRAPLVIKKSVTLEGANAGKPQSEVVIKCDRTNAIFISADKVCLRNLHITLSEKVNVSNSDGADDFELEVDDSNSRGYADRNEDVLPSFLEDQLSSKGKDNSFAAVRLTGGNLTVENCVIEGESKVTRQKDRDEQRGLQITGASSHLTMKNSQITCLDTGVLIAEGATGVMTDCHFEYNGNAFGVLTKGSLECDKITATRNFNGAMFSNHAKSVVRNSSFTKNWNVNMGVMAIGPVTVGELRIEDTKFAHSTKGLMTVAAPCSAINCEFSNHYEGGVLVAKSTLRMDQCKFHDNKCGVNAIRESKLIMKKCALNGGQYGVDALGSQIVVSESLFSDIGEAVRAVDSVVSEKNNMFENNINDVVKR